MGKLGLVKLGLVVGLLAAGRMALAQEGWYAGLTLGASNAELPNTLVYSPGAVSYSLSGDQRDQGFKVLAGYRFNRYFAMEGGYAHLGEFRGTPDITAPITAAINADLRTRGLVVDAVGIVPMRPGLSLYGKAGAFLSGTRTFRAASGAAGLPLGLSPTDITDEINPKVGLGIKYDLTENATLRGELERYWGVRDYGTGEQDVDLYSIGLNLRF